MRRFVEEETDDADRWMVSYADFITLLFAFFVVMYAISSVNDEKYRVLSATLKQAFEIEILSADLIQTGEPALAASPHVVDIPDSLAHVDTAEGDTFVKDTATAEPELPPGFIQRDGVSVENSNEWLELSFRDSVLFQPGSAVLSQAGRQALSETLQVVRDSTHAITVEGYSDNVPSTSSRYPSNWELSSARASAVARYFGQQGIREERMSAIGYGENHPVATNATPEGRAANRRVVVVLSRQQDTARNRNATVAVAVPSSAEVPDAPVAQRKDDGGLLFTSETQLEEDE